MVSTLCCCWLILLRKIFVAESSMPPLCPLKLGLPDGIWSWVWGPPCQAGSDAAGGTNGSQHKVTAAPEGGNCSELPRPNEPRSRGAPGGNLLELCFQVSPAEMSVSTENWIGFSLPRRQQNSHHKGVWVSVRRTCSGTWILGMIAPGEPQAVQSRRTRQGGV